MGPIFDDLGATPISSFSLARPDIIRPACLHVAISYGPYVCRLAAAHTTPAPKTRRRVASSYQAMDLETAGEQQQQPDTLSQLPAVPCLWHTAPGPSAVAGEPLGNRLPGEVYRPITAPTRHCECVGQGRRGGSPESDVLWSAASG
jgi:hypothetical protein